MTHLIHKFDASTNEIIEREMTAEELVEYQEYQNEAVAEKQKKISKEEELKSLKIAAYQKLGLTQKEIDALLPPPPPNQPKEQSL